VPVCAFLLGAGGLFRQEVLPGGLDRLYCFQLGGPARFVELVNLIRPGRFQRIQRRVEGFLRDQLATAQGIAIVFRFQGSIFVGPLLTIVGHWRILRFLF